MKPKLEFFKRIYDDGIYVVFLHEDNLTNNWLLYQGRDSFNDCSIYKNLSQENFNRNYIALITTENSYKKISKEDAFKTIPHLELRLKEIEHPYIAKWKEVDWTL